MFRTVLVSLALAWTLAAQAGAPPLRSSHVVVVDEATGAVLLDKNGDAVAPIASLTKLVTAMVVLDARQDMQEPLRITAADLDTVKYTRLGVRPGSVVTRSGLLELALIASDNRAAMALARHHPGGMEAFVAAVQRKIAALGLQHTVIVEPTGLSPDNRASALDMVKILRAAADYPEIAEITRKREHQLLVNGRKRIVHNTNRLVGRPGWEILLSKTGFTNEAGRCLAMRLQAAGRSVAVVMMGAVGNAQRTRDALKIRRWLASQRAPLRAEAASVQ
ncbi:MAG: serine hydrolase [Pseudomonadota bacterium]